MDTLIKLMLLPLILPFLLVKAVLKFLFWGFVILINVLFIGY